MDSETRKPVGYDSTVLAEHLEAIHNEQIVANGYLREISGKPPASWVHVFWRFYWRKGD